MPTYPTALDLMESLLHCSGCRDTSPEVDGDGITECCTKRACLPDPENADRQAPCCAGVAELLEKEQAAGGAPVRTGGGRTQPSPAPARPARRRKARNSSPQIDETRDLQTESGDANLVSHQGEEAPKPNDTEENEMTPTAPASESPATKAVFRNLQKDGEDTFEPVGLSFGQDREMYETLAKAYLSDRTKLATKTINGADWDAIFKHFVTDKLPAAPAPAETPAAPAAKAPAKGTRRAALGAASAPGWELLYDKPKQNCEVGRKYDGTKPSYALICKAHAHVHPLARLTAERTIRTAGGWCPECAK
ncbi:hypothetical protein [Streptomyces sp. NPDC059278]|uniref:hypothetical protein n=1 Tax=Streptomyces sp. NPDC059278 TaxID=3346801 RepID=UPI00368632B2